LVLTEKIIYKGLHFNQYFPDKNEFHNALKPGRLLLFLFMDRVFSKEFMNAPHFCSKKK